VRGKTSKLKLLTLVSIGGLEKDGATNDKEVKRGLNASSRSVKGASSTRLDFKGRKDPQPS